MKFMYKDGFGEIISDDDVDARRAEGWTDHPNEVSEVEESPEVEPEIEAVESPEFQGAVDPEDSVEE